MQNDFDEWIFFSPPTPPWSLTREVPQCHFHLNVNLKTLSLRLAWMLIRFESLFASHHNGSAKLWAVCHLTDAHWFFFSSLLPQRTPISVFFGLSLVEKVFLSTLIFSGWQYLAPKHHGRISGCYGSSIPLFFQIAGLFCSVLWQYCLFSPHHAARELSKIH